MKRLALLIAVACGAAFAAHSQETYKYAQKDTSALFLDVYRAAEGSETTLQGKPKPTIVFVFGGGFVMGERSDQWYLNWFRTFNEHGYTLVTIDYRLGMKGYKVKNGLRGTIQASEQFYLSQQMGVEDLFSAISFLDDNKVELGIDPGNIVLTGNSAGAIISLAAEYDILCGRAQGLPEGFNFKGIMAFAGAIISLKGAPDFPAAPCPLLLMHGTADKAVAYDHYGVMGRGLWGSSYLAENLAKKGYRYSIYRYKDRTHDVAAYVETLWDLEEDFIENDVILGRSRTIDAMVDDPGLPTWGDISLDSMYRKK